MVLWNDVIITALRCTLPKDSVRWITVMISCKLHGAWCRIYTIAMNCLLRGSYVLSDLNCSDHRAFLFWDVTIASEAQYRLTNNLSRKGFKIEQDSFSRPLWQRGLPWELLSARESSKNVKSWVLASPWEPSWVPFWRLMTVKIAFQKALEDVLNVHCWTSLFLKDVSNEINTFRGSWALQNLPQTRHNTCFEL